MRACDLLVWPAVREAYGMALLEAQASGLPVLAGRDPRRVAAILADGETGLNWSRPLRSASLSPTALDKILLADIAGTTPGHGRCRPAARVLQHHSLSKPRHGA